jgi:hypothetical protein
MADVPREQLTRAVEDLQRLEPSTSVRLVMQRIPVEGRAGEIIARALRRAGLRE